MRFLSLFYARLIGKVRIIAANARTAAVCPSRGSFARISRTPLDAGYGRLCIVGGGFRLDAQKFTCYEALNCFTCPFAIPRFT
ncbi:MAG: hypothetical protein IPL33_20465 [Sphingobacteriales bacterium]|nr:hypothetical protein [Sphingobacteriales bacterium]